MPREKVLRVPLNRVEGDLDITVNIAGGKVKDAWCSGVMFRGFERILVGRGALDGLVITPRVCGICGTAHLTAASRALDSVAGVEVPDELVTRMKGAKDAKEEGLKICLEAIEQLRQMPGVHGLHVMAVGWEAIVPVIMEEAGLLPRPSFQIES